MIEWLLVGMDLAIEGVQIVPVPTDAAGWGERIDPDIVLQSSDDDGDGFLAVVAGFFIGLGLIVAGVDKYRKGRLIRDTATETVRSMAVGRTELEGTAHAVEAPNEQPLTDGECLYAAWEIEEYTRDDDDDRSWDTIASGTVVDPFLLADGTGEVLVDATADATWEITGDLSQQWIVGRGNSPPSDIASFCRSQGVDPIGSVKRRYSQEVLPPEHSVYVLGEATPRELTDDDADMTDAGDRLKIRRDGGSDRFIISNLDEESLAERYLRQAKQYVVGGLLLSTICLTIILFWITSV